MGQGRMRTAAVLVMLAAMSTTGCKKLIQKAIAKKVAEATAGDGGLPSLPTGTTNGKGKDAQEDADDQLNSKLNGYIADCRNSFSSNVMNSIQRYYSWVDDKKGITGKEKLIYGLYKINNDPEKCATAVTKSNGMQPGLPALEKAASEYVVALKAVVPLIAEANKYYENGDYKDDKLAKGKAMHPNLAASFGTFEKANNALRLAIEEQKAGLDQRMLARIERDEGKKAHWHVQNVYLLGKALLQENEMPEKIVLDRFKGAAEAFGAAVDNLDAYSNTDKTGASKASSVLSSAQAVNKAAKELLRRVRDKKPYSSFDKRNLGTSAGWMVEGSPDQVLDRYNKMIQAMNNIHW